MECFPQKCFKKLDFNLNEIKKGSIFATAIGEMAEWSNAAVLKTVEGHTSGGSNPSFSAKRVTLLIKAHRHNVCELFVFINVS
jgi:hypothetical protein